jgi:hypothetical protein
MSHVKPFDGNTVSTTIFLMGMQFARPWGMNFWTPQTGKMGDGSTPIQLKKN